MKKTLATLALATLPGLLFSACNGGTTVSGVTPALPSAPTASHHGRVHRMDNGPQDLHAGGADIPAIAYNLGSQPIGYYNQSQPAPLPGSLFYAAPTTGTIYYCLTSSTDGRKAFYGNGDSQFPPTGPCAPLGQSATGYGGRQDPLDFVASAVALASTECCSSSTPYYQYRLQGSQTWGQPFEFPQIGGPIVYTYRPQDFKISKLKLSTWSYCAIANGTVSDWNDPAITADNGKSVTGGVSETLTFYFRSDSAGATYNYTNHLNTVCNGNWKAPYNSPPYQTTGRSAAWPFGVNSSWPGPGSSSDPNSNFIGEAGDPGIIAAIEATGFSTGYNEGAYVPLATPKLSQALLQNGYKKGHGAIFLDPENRAALTLAFKRVTSANITYGGGSDGNPLQSSTPWCQLYIDPKNYVNPPAKSYPIVDVSYLLFYGNNNGVHISDKQKLVAFLESRQSNAIINKLEYIPFSSSVQSAVTTALAGNGSKAPCLQ